MITKPYIDKFSTAPRYPRTPPLPPVPYTVTPATRTSKWRADIATHEAALPVPVFHITRSALADLIAAAASVRPEAGGLGFGLHDKQGVDVVEFDEQGSQRASYSVYANDGVWSNARQQFHLQGTPVRTLQMAWHTHPGSVGKPSGKAGYARGDMGMFEAFFDMNPWMQQLQCPILTHGCGKDGGLSINLNPWLATRNPAGGINVSLAKLQIHEEASTLPPAIFNPAWEAETVQQQSSQTNFAKNSEAHRNEYISRISSVVSPAFHNKTILCIGTGGGSYFAEKLSRYLPRKLILVDPDTVSVSNLARTNFSYADACNARLKTDALRERINAVNPFVQVESLPTTLAGLPKAEIERLMQEADLIVEGTDSFESKKLTNELARAHQVPAIYIGVHANAYSGRLIWSYPGISPCYECAAWERYTAHASSQAQAAAAPTLNLDSAAGAVADIQLIDMMALRITLAMLEAGQTSASGRFFEQLRGQGSDITVRTSLESPWGKQMFGALLADLPLQPKPFAAELNSYFIGIDATAFPASRKAECQCQTHARKALKKRLLAVA